MESRLELMRYIMEKHRDSYRDHMMEAMLGIVCMGRGNDGLPEAAKKAQRGVKEFSEESVVR